MVDLVRRSATEVACTPFTLGCERAGLLAWSVELCCGIIINNVRNYQYYWFVSNAVRKS